MPAGPPTKYRAAYAKRLPEMFANGEGVAEVADRLGVTKATFYNWCHEHKAFADAYAKGKQKSELWWQTKGRQAVCGEIDGFNSAVWVFSMKNKFGWTDKVKEESDTNITIKWQEPDG